MLLMAHMHVLSLSVALYTDSTKSPIFTFTDLGSGVTHMQFTKDGHKLLVGYRKV